jgi:hypothetical protein
MKLNQIPNAYIGLFNKAVVIIFICIGNIMKCIDSQI